MFQIQNNSAEDVSPILDMLNQFVPFSQKRLGFNKPVSLFLQSDEENANKVLGKTAFYDPSEFSVTVFTSGRHPKDILRSLSHELVHHAQNCRGEFDGDHIAGEGYAQKDPHMRNMEREAYERGNIIFRDFEDLIKADEINITLSGDAKMSIKEWKDKELNMLLMEKWGYRKEDDKAKKDERADEEGDRPSMAKDMDLKEGCPDLEGDEMEIDISKPDMGMEVHVQDLDDLSPDEAFGAGWAAAAQAIEDALASGPEEAVEAGDEMGEEEEEEDLMERKSLSLAEAKEIAKRIFTKLLRENGDDDDDSAEEKEEHPQPAVTDEEGKPIEHSKLFKKKKEEKKKKEKKEHRLRLLRRLLEKPEQRSPQLSSTLSPEQRQKKTKELEANPEDDPRPVKSQARTPTPLGDIPEDDPRPVKAINRGGRVAPDVRGRAAAPDAKSAERTTLPDGTPAFGKGSVTSRRNRAASLSIDEAKVIAKKIFEKLLREADRERNVEKINQKRR